MHRAKKIVKKYPELNSQFVQDYFSSFSRRYFNYFSEEDQLIHMKELAGLSKNNPVKILFDINTHNHLCCTVISFDYKGAFAVIAGILAAMGIEVSTGEVFTSKKKKVGKDPRKKNKDIRGVFVSGKKHLNKRYIVDYFSGEMRDVISMEKSLKELRTKLEIAFILLEEGNESSEVKVRSFVNELVAKRLRKMKKILYPALYPVQLQIDNRLKAYTRLKIISQDTPFFLYSLASSLLYYGVSIEHVHINTFKNRIEDEIFLLDKNGGKIKSQNELNQLKLSVMLVKQMTYFLDRAPNAYDAISRFGELVHNVLTLPGRGQWIKILSNPRALQDMARLLGASDFLWEDFIRLHYESLLPVIKSELRMKHVYSKDINYAKKLSRFMGKIDAKKMKVEKLNEFKDYEIFLIDLNHILGNMDFRTFAEQLSILAEVVLSYVIKEVYEELTLKYGVPDSVSGIESLFSVFGLGKFGGKALGYGSDLELLFVYSDNGFTSGSESISNSEFFDRLVKGVVNYIDTKEGKIFQLDLRLRPYGKDGPLAVSLENFCHYYGPEGDSMFFEKLSLVRLRAIYGDKKFGERIERLRYEFIYSSLRFDLNEIWDIRKKQFDKYIKGRRYNAKLSPGALVDIEYAVQILQVINGSEYIQLRTSRIHEALIGLVDVRVINEEDGFNLNKAYDFFRKCINGLRMLRGHSRDLYMPLPDSYEYEHLARRIGYVYKGDMGVAKQLHLDFEMYSATVRVFIEKQFKRYNLLLERVGNVADLLLTEELSENIQFNILAKAGFRNLKRAYRNLKAISQITTDKLHFARLAVLACDFISKKSDPDRALNNWERFISVINKVDEHISLLLAQPKRLDILLDIFSVSQFLADTLIRYPGIFEWVTEYKILFRKSRRGLITEEMYHLSRSYKDYGCWLDNVRRFRRRELLRIAIRDISIGVSLKDTMTDLSMLAEGIIQGTLARVWQDIKNETADIDVLETYFCLLAFGKLGASELNYSSDVDLIAIYDEQVITESNMSLYEVEQIYSKVVDKVSRYLSSYTIEGHTYRVDLTLRPYGKSGNLVTSKTALLMYYDRNALYWEIQALLKARPVAGAWWLGYEFIRVVKEKLKVSFKRGEVAASIKSMRDKAVNMDKAKVLPGVDIKNGIGGIRDIEFLVQGLQLINMEKYPDIFCRDTLSAIVLINKAGLLSKEVSDSLRDNYVFFRKIEHFLQIFEDLQTHVLPAKEKRLSVLAKQVLGNSADTDDLMKRLDRGMGLIRSFFDRYL
ncbi:MAG: hypothetical protein GY730_02830 [bacterium]|nr:hypothetical protein [bacterium]